MTCCRMLTESLLATLAYVAPNTYFTEQDICDYYSYLLEHMPIYVTTNLSREMIENVVREYPDVFKLKYGVDAVAVSGDTTSCINYFLGHGAEMQQLILNTTKTWLKERSTT